MFPFDPSENVRKPKVFWCFQGDQMETLGRKGLMITKQSIYYSWWICNEGQASYIQKGKGFGGFGGFWRILVQMKKGTGKFWDF